MTGRWLPFGFRRALGRPGCWVLCEPTPIPVDNWISVVRKGSRVLQQVPASPDAFVWLRLYQAEMDGLASTGAEAPLWLTLGPSVPGLELSRRPGDVRTGERHLGRDWTLHDLRHSAAYRIAHDPDMPLTDVQWVLGHAHLSTTQLYVTAPLEDVVETVSPTIGANMTNAFSPARASRRRVPAGDPGRLVRKESGTVTSNAVLPVRSAAWGPARRPSARSAPTVPQHALCARTLGGPLRGPTDNPCPAVGATVPTGQAVCSTSAQVRADQGAGVARGPAGAVVAGALGGQRSRGGRQTDWRHFLSSG